MRKRTKFLISPLLIVGVLLVFASSCKKDDSIPVLSTSAVTDITQTTAISGGNITSDGGATVTGRGVCWSTGQTPTIFDNKTTDGTGTGTFASNISGLTANATYYARAYATNSAGTGYGSTMSFTTLEAIGLPVLSTTEVTEITQTTAVVGGSITDDGGATVTARGVCWSTRQTPTILDNKTTDGAETGTFVSNICGLTADATYYARAYATNSKGTAYGNTISFTTSFTDLRDGNVYQTVTIGTQVWMAENLKYLPSVVGNATSSNTEAYYYVYDYDGTDISAAKATANYDTYGVLYNWSAAMSGSASSSLNPSGVQGVCPTGWHLPSDAEWKQLIYYLGGERDAARKLKEIGTTHWTNPNADATNESGFTALPGGSYFIHTGFFHVGKNGGWWSATEENTHFAWFLGLGEMYNYSKLTIHYNNKVMGYSVRCVRD